LVPLACLVESIEHCDAPAMHKMRRRQEARLTKVVCADTTLSPKFTEMNPIEDALKEDSEKIA
jgi:hypothetical protein